MNKEKWLDDNGNEITEEYIIINKTAIQKRIEELGKEYISLSNKSDRSLSDIEEEREIVGEQKALAKILSQSTPLIPELEKVYDVGRSSFNSALSYEECKEDYYDYISNLKFDI